MKKKLLSLVTGLLVLALTACGQPAAPAESSAAESSVVESSAESSVAESSSVEESVEESSEEPVAPEVYLKDLFAEHGLKVGTCLTTSMTGRERLSNLVKDQFTSATMENDMKPDAFLKQGASKEAGDIVVEFNKSCLEMLEWCKNNGIALRGHTLVWYSQTPSWIFYKDFDTKKELVSREVMLGRMESMIKQVFQNLTDLGYIDLFYAYDVVNEAWMEDGSMRDNLWKQTIGDDYLWYAFYYADKYAPESIDLYYNDYNEQFKTQTLYNFVSTLVDEDGNYLIDGVGFQAHLYTSDNLTTYFNTMEKIASLGLKVSLTELDVCLGAWQKKQPATEDNLKKQGRYYYDLINGIFERVDNGTVKMDSLTFWGFSDALSWRKEYSPCLYDTMYFAKPAFYGAAQVKEFCGYENQQ